MWAGLRKSNRYDDHFKAGVIGAITSLLLREERRGSHYWDTESGSSAEKGGSLMGVYPLVEGWEPLMGPSTRRSQKNKYQVLCPSLPLISSQNPSFVESNQKSESKKDLMYSSQVGIPGHRAKWKGRRMDLKSKWGFSSTSSKSCSLEHDSSLDSGLKQLGKQPPPLRMAFLWKNLVIAKSTYVPSKGLWEA